MRCVVRREGRAVVGERAIGGRGRRRVMVLVWKGDVGGLGAVVAALVVVILVVWESLINSGASRMEVSWSKSGRVAGAGGEESGGCTAFCTGSDFVFFFVFGFEVGVGVSGPFSSCVSTCLRFLLEALCSESVCFRFLLLCDDFRSVSCTGDCSSSIGVLGNLPRYL